MSQTFDVIVIGGGCNGTGIARDAALRGLKVLLIEKNDFAAGATGASSGMIHGGPRYLLYEVGTTKLACKDAGYIKNIAPHLCFRIPFILPVLKKRSPQWLSAIYLELVETFFEVYDRFSHYKKGKPHTRLSRQELLQLEPSLSPDVTGAVTFDEWGIDTHRLCVANALSAFEAGAEIRNHSQVVGLLREENLILGVKVRHLVTLEEEELRAKIVFNAAGPWASGLAEMAGCIVKLRPSKGIHLVIDRRLTNMAIVARAVDGRQIFIEPHENTTIIGTTDDDYYGDLDDIPITEDEIEYLYQGIEAVVPDIREARIVTTWRGIRPTLYDEDRYENELSRSHRVYDHEMLDGVKGFLSIAGGKLASYREMSEEATDLVCKKLAVKGECQTHLLPLPGGEDVPDPQALAAAFGLYPYIVARLVYRHGHRARHILDLTRVDPGNKEIVCSCEPVIAAELRYCIRHEWAITLMDLMRRTRLAAGSCQGSCCAMRAGIILGQELQLQPHEVYKQVKDFLNELWKARAPILGGFQLAEEEMHHAIFMGAGGLDQVGV